VPPLKNRLFSLRGSLARTSQRHWSPGASLIRFHQFCDHHNVTEDVFMPVSYQLLAFFVAEARGTCMGSCICNWLCGLCLWHNYNDALWFSDDERVTLLKKSSVRAGLSFSHPACSPITLAHLRAFLAALDPEMPLIGRVPKHA
jgi:hypothetical protein